jgi:cytochrome c oxidase assembly factor CtaG
VGGDLFDRIRLDFRIVMSLAQFLVSAWNWEPTVLLGCAVLSLGYLAIARFHLTRKTLVYQVGVMVLFLALESPIDVLGEEYLFSAHMLQHLLLILIIPPLLLLGIPGEWFERLLDWKPADILERLLGRPAIALILAVVALYLWHIPALYDAAVENEAIHSLEHLIFLVGATIFWWPVINPIKERRRISGLGTMLYIFVGAVANTVLGIILTFAPAVLYRVYLFPADSFGILAMIRTVWSLDPLADQQLGGLLMWIPGGLFYLSAILVVFARWFSEPEEDLPLSKPNQNIPLTD